MKTTATLSLLGLVALVAAQGDPGVIVRLVDQGKNRSEVMKTLHTLTYDKGPRLTGSPKLLEAQNWAVKEFKRYGIANARLESWGEVPVGFERGARQIGRMVSPFRSDFVFSTPNWTPGTNGLVRAEAVRLPGTLDELTRAAKSLAGKWVVMPKAAEIRGVPVPSAEEKKLWDALDGIAIAGRIWGTADARVHSHGNWRDKSFENRPKTPDIIVRREDMDRIKRNLDLDRRTVLEFDIENLWFKGPIPQYNVVADIVGTEKPDEVVIVCGHLDSWNSPGSQGACDNGTGSAVAIEAARILMASGAKPKRTIRFILWSGEEQGLLGSRGYVETHKAELGKISAVLNDDGGTNYHGGYAGLETMKPMMEAAFAPTLKAFPSLPMRFDVVKEMPQGGSSDHAPFNWEGVPGFYTFETGRADYGHVWHTQFDRYEAAIPEYLVQSATNHAIVSYNLASAPTMLPRGPKPDRKAQALHAPMQAAGASDVYFDPHTLCDHEDDWDWELMDRSKRFFRGLLTARR